MVLIQALISFLGKSAGRILNAIFGWAVIALFGRRSPRQHTLLSGVVALAVLWPLLLAGVIAPKTAAFFLVFIPLTKSVPESTVRIIWIALAVAVPVLVGLVVAAKAAPGTARESFVRRVLRGFPVTVAIATAFVLMFFTVPILRIASALRGWSDEHVPLITEGDEYPEAASRIDVQIAEYGLGASRAAPPWWMSAPAGMLLRLGGRALRGFMPEKAAYWKGRGLQIALYPSDLLIRGDKKQAAWTHGLIAEAFGRGPGFQTFSPEAQDLERQVRRVWDVYEENPGAHVGSRSLLGRVTEMARDLGSLDVPYEQWQVAYRKIAQVARAIGGDPQLLESAAHAAGGTMSQERFREVRPERPLDTASTGELLSQFVRQTTELLKKEMELARAEIGSHVRSLGTMVAGFAAAAVFALLGLGLLSSAAVLALAQDMKPWVAALIVGIVMLVVAIALALFAKSKRVTAPLEKTRKTWKEDVQWAKERIA